MDLPNNENRVSEVRGFPARLALAALPITLLIFAMWLVGGERPAIEGLTPAERLAAYRSTLEAFEMHCIPPRIGLETTCAERARLLIYFPECEEHCRKVTLQHLRTRRA